jgi:adenine/guanine phosphoribosyltransferase-like PRPP-binding protein
MQKLQGREVIKNKHQKKFGKVLIIDDFIAYVQHA